MNEIDRTNLTDKTKAKKNKRGKRSIDGFRKKYEQLIKVDKNGHDYILFKTNIYFSDHKLAVETGEKEHTDRDLFFEKKKKDNKH